MSNAGKQAFQREIFSGFINFSFQLAFLFLWFNVGISTIRGKYLCVNNLITEPRKLRFRGFFKLHNGNFAVILLTVTALIFR
jgi:hypothetical protein